MLNTTVVAAVYDEYQRALAALDRLVTEVGVDHLSLVMADREAERHFSPAARNKLGVPLPLSEDALPVAQGLRPLAALGTRGTGLVASGPMVSILVGVGVGAGGGLRRGLTGLGVEQERVEQVFAKVRNGALIVGVHVDKPAHLKLAQRVLAEGSAIQLKLTADRETMAQPTLRQPTPLSADEARPSISPEELEFETSSRPAVRRAS